MGVFHGGDAATSAVELQTFSKLVKHFFIFTSSGYILKRLINRKKPLIFRKRCVHDQLIAKNKRKKIKSCYTVHSRWNGLFSTFPSFTQTISQYHHYSTLFLRGSELYFLTITWRIQKKKKKRYDDFEIWPKCLNYRFFLQGYFKTPYFFFFFGKQVDFIGTQIFILKEKISRCPFKCFTLIFHTNNTSTIIFPIGFFFW